MIRTLPRWRDARCWLDKHKYAPGISRMGFGTVSSKVSTYQAKIQTAVRKLMGLQGCKLTHRIHPPAIYNEGTSTPLAAPLSPGTGQHAPLTKMSSDPCDIDVPFTNPDVESPTTNPDMAGIAIAIASESRFTAGTCPWTPN
jgi:hypothetical protein